MPDTEKDVDSIEKFEPPKLPFAWLGSTFLAPAAVIILPNMLNDHGLSFEFRLSIALGLLSIMLLVSCIGLLFKLYDMSYLTQILRYKMSMYFNEQKALISRLDSSQQNLEKLEKRILDFEQLQREKQKEIN